MIDTREKLNELLSVPIYPHLDADPAEVVADYLIANGVRLETETSDKTSDEKASEWIPVSERLPEKEEWVMCACVDGEVNILRYDHIMDDWDLFHRPNRCYKKEYVTHWMPLPEPPKE